MAARAGDGLARLIRLETYRSIERLKAQGLSILNTELQPRYLGV